MLRTRWLATAAVALAPLAAARPAAVATSAGHAALALAAIVGQYDPALTYGVKAGLLRLLADQAFGFAKTGTVSVKADAVTCRAGDVDLKAYGCTLTFGARTVSLKGRQAAELYATLIEAGVPSEGAAGTLYESVKTLACTLDIKELAGPGMGDGGGATCSYQPGP